MNQKQIWENNLVRVEYSDRQLYFIDKTDHFNEPRGYTKKVRGIEKAVIYLNTYFDNIIDFSKLINDIDDRFDLRIHTYCAMD